MHNWKHYKTFKQVFLFTVGGATSALVELSSFSWLLTFISIFWAALISFCMALLTSYLLNSHFVFKSQRTKKQFISFVGLGIFNAFLSSVSVAFLASIIHYPVWAKVITMGLIAIWSFLAMKFLIFREMGNSRQLP